MSKLSKRALFDRIIAEVYDALVAAFPERVAQELLELRVEDRIFYPDLEMDLEDALDFDPSSTPEKPRNFSEVFTDALRWLDAERYVRSDRGGSSTLTFHTLTQKGVKDMPQLVGLLKGK